MKRFIGDFETRSKVDLKKCGGYKYSTDESTQPTCFSFKIRGEHKVYFMDFFLINTPWKKLPESFKIIWLRFIFEDYEFSAHNALFETCIYKNILVARYGWPDIPFRNMRCTAAKAAACALPRNLEGAGAALGLNVQKDKRGHAAMHATCKPTKKWKAWKKLQDDVAAGKRITEKRRLKASEPEPPMFLEPMPLEEINRVVKNPYGYDAETVKRANIWNDLYVYCKIDTRSEEELDMALPDLIPVEQELWFLNQRLNWRGIRLDIPTVTKIVNIMDAESKIKLEELDSLTMGLVTKPAARKSILEFLALDNVFLPDIKAKTVDDALKSGKLSPDMQSLLEIRKALSKSSTKKYQSFINRASIEDDRARDLLMYHGASTGRDTGTGLQIHNFPRGIISVDKSQPYASVQDVIECDPDFLRLLYGENLSMLFSSILRNMILPAPGRKIIAGDFSKIEVAVLWWLSKNWAGLKILKSGLDPYIYQAAENKHVTYEEIDKEGDDRQLGKAQVLGCGFGMGADKFQTTAFDMYRLKLTIEQSRQAVKSYREANKAVPQMWKDVEQAAIAAVENKGRTFMAARCKFFFQGRFLWIELPSGRRLAYCDPQISWREVFDQSQKTLEFWGVNPKTKKWALERTWGGTLTENIVQAVARDIMMEGALRLEKKDYLLLFTVHDEGVCDFDEWTGSISEFKELMEKTPLWADEDLPIGVNAWVGERYRK